MSESKKEELGEANSEQFKFTVKPVPFGAGSVPAFYANAVNVSWDDSGEFCLNLGRWQGSTSFGSNDSNQPVFYHELSVFMTQSTSLSFVDLLLNGFDPKKLPVKLIEKFQKIIDEASSSEKEARED